MTPQDRAFKNRMDLERLKKSWSSVVYTMILLTVLAFLGGAIYHITVPQETLVTKCALMDLEDGAWSKPTYELDGYKSLNSYYINRTRGLEIHHSFNYTYLHTKTDVIKLTHDESKIIKGAIADYLENNSRTNFIKNCK